MFLNVRAISVPRTKRKYLDFRSCQRLRFFTARPLKISPRFNSFKYVELKSEKQLDNLKMIFYSLIKPKA